MNIHSNTGEYLYIAQSTLVNTMESVCTIQYYKVLYSTIQYYTVIYSKMNSLKCTKYNTQCIIHRTQFIIYSVQFTKCTEYTALITVHTAYCTHCHSDTVGRRIYSL